MSWQDHEAAAQKISDSVARPEAARLDQLIHYLEGQVDELRLDQSDRAKWLEHGPDLGIDMGFLLAYWRVTMVWR